MKVISWNIEGRLSDLACDNRGTPEKIVEAIRTLDADVLVHPEAFGMHPPMQPEIEAAVRGLGYTAISTDYDDLIGRGEKAAVDHPHLMILSRLAIKSHEVIRPGNLRNMLSATVIDPATGRDLRVIGVHLEDREEQLRLRQVGPLIKYVNSSDVPTVMMGDFNAMPPDTPRSRLIHGGLFRDPAKLIPHAHMRYTMARLSEMASGMTVAKILGETRLVNTDPKLQPTTTPKMRKMEWLPSVRLAKIDWIFVSPDITYSNFAISLDLGSDHRALSLDISL